MATSTSGRIVRRVPVSPRACSGTGGSFGTRIGVGRDAPLTDSACVYCGNCIEVCPTGALSFRPDFIMRAAGR